MVHWFQVGKGCQQNQTGIGEYKMVVSAKCCHSKIPVGVISDCHNGIYIGEDVQALAYERGWIYNSQFPMVMKNDDTLELETYTWAWDEAEQFLNDNVAEESHYFGSQPMAGCGCWGYWKVEEDEYNISSLSPTELKYEEAKNWERDLEKEIISWEWEC